MHGVIFDNKHTYRDWGLLEKSRPIVSPPKPKLKLISVPGSDDVIDLTEHLTGKVHYEPRTISFEFVTIAERERWPQLYSEILNAIHGKRIRIVMDEDPNYYYIGRVNVDGFEPEPKTKTAILTMTAEVEPYKRERFGEGKCL